MLNGAEYILEKIKLLGVKYIFGIPGGHIDPLLTAAAGSEIEVVINCHELSAAYMADGYSRSSNTIGVVTTLGGPGANNIVTAVNIARIEKIPLLVITGDMPTKLADVPGFQCGNELGTNDDAIFKSITKYSKRIKNIEDLTNSLEEAVNIALTPPFGPAHLIVPYNVFNETTAAKPKPVDFDSLKYWDNNFSSTTISKIKELIISDKKIIFWIGNSLNKKEQAKQILKLAEKFHIPVATSFSAKGVFPENHELALGNFGYAGSSFSKAVFLSEEPDILIGFDIEQNERNSLNWNPKLYNGKKFILVNYPGSYSNSNYGESIEDNPFYILKSLADSLNNEEYDYSERRTWFNNVRQKFSLTTPKIPTAQNGTIEPGLLIQILHKELPEESVLFVDSGTHRVFPGFFWKAAIAASYFSSSIVAPLGWAISAAIGGKFDRKEPVIIFTGDGCMQMHGIELKTAIKHNKPVLVVLTNNSAFGAIYNRFKKISDNAAKMVSITEINWNMFGKSLGVEVFDITSKEQFIEQIRAFLANQKTTILNVTTPVSPYIHDTSLTKSAYA
jgi:acetolactate synthase-1/2/3 large subunit